MNAITYTVRFYGATTLQELTKYKGVAALYKGELNIGIRTSYKQYNSHEVKTAKCS